MTRQELESLCLAALDAGDDCIRVNLPGDPSASRVRLFGHRLGPRGTVVGWSGNNVTAKFDASQVLEYIDTLPIDSEII